MTYSNPAMVRSNARQPELLPTTRIGRRDFLAADVGNKHVLMNVDKGVYIGLDDVGKDIWGRLEEPQTIAMLCERLQTAYAVADRALFEGDVTEFIARLRLHGLVEVLLPLPDEDEDEDDDDDDRERRPPR